LNPQSAIKANQARRGSELNEESLPIRLQLTQVQALEYLDFTGVQAVFGAVRSSLVIASLLPSHRSPGEDLGEDLGETFLRARRWLES